MSYAVKELFFTLQGEGANTGRPSVFCRFAGCNLWSGLEADRATAICTFCDTEFVGTDGDGGGRFASARDLAAAAKSKWPDGADVTPFLVCTGGEPLLQLDDDAIEAFHGAGFEVAVETNGTRVAPRGLDWVCVSPKAGAGLHQCKGDELKLVYPQAGAPPRDFEGLDFAHFFLQPMDGSAREHNTTLALGYCREHPQWQLSLQTHKYLGIR
ncbi:MAG: 7-carboxy-7-deazaguanine synthase [Alphaproteobacteria bacterium]